MTDLRLDRIEATVVPSLHTADHYVTLLQLCTYSIQEETCVDDVL